MADNPNKKAQDRKFVSQQPHEQRYQAMKREKASHSSKRNDKTSRKNSK